MKTVSLRTVNRPNGVIEINARDEDQFIELRAMYPYHETVFFTVHCNGSISGILKPLLNVVPINRKYMVDAYDQVDRESWLSTPGAFHPEAA